MKHLEVVYRLASSDDAVDRVESILIEQSIETPPSVAERYPFVRDNMMGSIQEVVPDGEGGLRATLLLPFVTASVDPAQFLNVLFGNSSLHEGVTLVDFEPPDEVTELLPGPRFGVAGLREFVGVRDRPLTCGALKPVGMSLDEMAAVCRAMARGELDLIKDDHYLADHPFARFEDRVVRCQNVVEDAGAAANGRSVYVPNLSGHPDEVRRQAEAAQKAGVRAVMMAPMLLGLPTFHAIVRTELDVPVLAHPSFGGLQSIHPPAVFGKLFRLYGADAVIFPNFGGRFSFSPVTCREIASNLRSDWLTIRPAFPVPAGGMDAARAVELVEFFGQDVVLLVGGSLLEAGDDLEEKTRHFTESVRTAAQTLSKALKNESKNASSRLS